MVRRRRRQDIALAAGRTGRRFDPLSCRRVCRGKPVVPEDCAADQSVKLMPGSVAIQFDRLALPLLGGTGVVLAGLTAATPFAFEAYGDNAFIALTIAAGLLTIVSTRLAGRAPRNRALWLVFGFGIAIRA